MNRTAVRQPAPFHRSRFPHNGCHYVEDLPADYHGWIYTCPNCGVRNHSSRDWSTTGDEHYSRI